MKFAATLSDRMARGSRLRNQSGFLLGFALGGFFDGILLHQVLQWHHLLSALQGDPFRDPRVQILADGLFHVLMYFVALAGLVMLWRARDALGMPDAGRRLIAYALTGFGVWHIVDGVLSHWILGIHRIRMGTANPLFWDLLWFILFGAVFLVVGWWMKRGAGSMAPPGPSRGAMAALILGAMTLLAGPIAALPPPDVRTSLVLFKPGTTTDEIFAAVAAVNGGIVWADRSGLLWAIKVDKGRNPMRLYRYGALLVGNAGLSIGCLSWVNDARLRVTSASG